MLPPVILLLVSMLLIPFWHSIGIAKEEAPYGIVALLIFTLMLSIPAVLIWRAVFRSLWQNEVRRTTFQSVEDLEYYRDKLTGLSPAEISLLTDLKIEPEKDVAATLLQYQLQGRIRMTEGRVEVLRPQGEDLPESGRLLLRYLSECDLRSPDFAARLPQWERATEQEALSGAYLRYAGARNAPNSCLGCLGAALVPILTLVATALFASSGLFQYTGQVLDALESAGAGNPELFSALAADHRFVFGVLGMLAVFYLLIFGFVWPIARFIRGVVRSSAASQIRFRRTPAGEELTEQIYGLKNFLHDFSTLSEATKDYLALWDEFLVYAVVLEENEIILEEIFGRRGLTAEPFFVRPTV